MSRRHLTFLVASTTLIFFLGCVFGIPISREGIFLERDLGLRGHVTFRIDGVEPGSLAEKAGLQEGDLIWRVGGEDLISIDHLQHKVEMLSPGEQVKIRYLRFNRDTDVFENLCTSIRAAVIENPVIPPAGEWP